MKSVARILVEAVVTVLTIWGLALAIGAGVVIGMGL